ncbi:sodium:calcium antiporter [Anaerostipes faecalis]|uniref:sodium:calcium antiporter n=1 Tax=Anaerostipes faecalis TaxID=2738446 RepID=UPI003EFDBAB7
MQKMIQNVPMAIVVLIIGFIFLVKGADFFVEGSSGVAKRLKVPSVIIGLTIVAIGTSLPELVTSVVAARKNEVDMALGNAIGSNIFNILMVIGITGAISPIEFITENIIDISVLFVFSIIVWCLGWKNKGLKRKEGICMIALYAIYMFYICIR